jgi:hypothetical protein
MAQVQVRANLMAADFPLVSKFQGRTVLFGQSDQKSSGQEAIAITGKDNDNSPECYYMENVLPTAHGYKSVAYKALVRSVPGVVFNRLIPIRDSDIAPFLEQDRGYIATTVDGRTFLLTTIGNTIWTEVTPAGQPAGSSITVATVSGITYICYSYFGVFKADMHTKILISVTLTGVTAGSIAGIGASNNYLLLHDSSIIYWSSAITPTDFVPSLITGAGSATPASTGGPIVCISPVATGFAVYTSSNIILASFSGNTRFPWIFKEAPNGAGIESVTQVSSAGDDGSNYAWTTSGLLKITLVGATILLPELTDFLSSAMIENYNAQTKTLSTTYLTSKMHVSISYNSSRYLVISYGISATEFSHAIIYDLALKRVGKLAINHVTAFELTVSDAGTQLTYLQTAPLDGTGSTGMTSESFSNLVATPAAPKHTLAFMQSTGIIQLAIEDYNNFNSNGVLLLGKYQLLRNNLVTLQGVSTETIDAANTNFTISDIVTYDGVTYAPAQALVPASSGEVRQFNSRITGLNHSILIEGAFNLVSLILSFSKHGRS